MATDLGPVRATRKKNTFDIFKQLCDAIIVYKTRNCYNKISKSHLFIISCLVWHLSLFLSFLTV